MKTPLTFILVMISITLQAQVTTKVLNIDSVSYFQVKSGIKNPAILAAVNDSLKHHVSVKQNQGKYVTAFNRNKILTVQLIIKNAISRTYTINIFTGKELNFKDVFKEDSYETLLKFVKRESVSNCSKNNIFNSGDAMNFLLNQSLKIVTVEDKTYIHFQPGCTSEDENPVTFTANELKKYLKPEMLFLSADLSD